MSLFRFVREYNWKNVSAAPCIRLSLFSTTALMSFRKTSQLVIQFTCSESVMLSRHEGFHKHDFACCLTSAQPFNQLLHKNYDYGTYRRMKLTENSILDSFSSDLFPRCFLRYWQPQPTIIAYNKKKSRNSMIRSWNSFSQHKLYFTREPRHRRFLFTHFGCIVRYISVSPHVSDLRLFSGSIVGSFAGDGGQTLSAIWLLCPTLRSTSALSSLVCRMRPVLLAHLPPVCHAKGEDEEDVLFVSTIPHISSDSKNKIH